MLPALHVDIVAHDEVWAGTKASRRKRVHATPASSCRLATNKRYTQNGPIDLADSVMTEIRPSEYVPGRAPAAHENLARTARAGARTSAATVSYVVAGIKARAPPALSPGRIVGPAALECVLCMRQCYYIVGQDGICRHWSKRSRGRCTLLW